jgi:hypothetical protein
MKYFSKTFGCQMNFADSDEMIRQFANRGLEASADLESAQVALINTCTVRDLAEHKAMSYIGRLKTWKQEHPNSIIVVTGCAAERAKKDIKRKFPHVDLIVGAKDIDNFGEAVDKLLPKNVASHFTRKSFLPSETIAATTHVPMEEEPEAVTLARDRARLLGEVVHKVLEEWNFTAKHSGVKLGAAVMKAGRVFELNSEIPEDKALLAEAIEILEGFLTSPQAAKLKTVKILGREVPFVYSDDRGTMHGFIDLLYEDSEGLVVADYKTTKVKGDIKKAAAKYDPQSIAYREAVSRVFKKPVRFEVIFLRSLGVPPPH